MSMEYPKLNPKPSSQQSNEFFDPNENDEFTDDGRAYFERYLEGLQISREDLKGKVLDVGSNTGTFAKWAKENNVSGQIFSLDPWFVFEERTKAVQGIVEMIPFKDESFDLVVSNCAIPNIFLGEKDVEEKIHSSLFEMFRVTKPGGEIRLGNVGKGDLYPTQKEHLLALEKTLEELKKDFKAEIEQTYIPESDRYEPTESELAGKLLSQAYFIKIKKPE